MKLRVSRPSALACVPRRVGSSARESGSRDGLLEQVTREEAHDPPGGNGGRGTRLGVAAHARSFGAHLRMANPPKTSAASGGK